MVLCPSTFRHRVTFGRQKRQRGGGSLSLLAESCPPAGASFTPVCAPAACLGAAHTVPVQTLCIFVERFKKHQTSQSEERSVYLVVGRGQDGLRAALTRSSRPGAWLLCCEDSALTPARLLLLPKSRCPKAN